MRRQFGATFFCLFSVLAWPHDFVFKPVLIGSSCSVHSLNDSGIVVGETASNEDTRGFVWNELDGATLLQSPFGLQTTARGINESGDVSGSFMAPDGHWQPCIWYGSFAFHDLGVPNGAVDAWSAGISDDGVVFGNYKKADGSIWPFWHSASMGINAISLPSGMRHLQLTAVGPSGLAVGMSNRIRRNSGLSGMYLFHGGLFSFLASPIGSMDACPKAVNREGAIVGTALIGQKWLPIVWPTLGDPYSLSLPPGYDQGGVFGISPEGATVGNLEPFGTGWTSEDHGIIDLNLLMEPSDKPLFVNAAVDVNDAEQILARSGTGGILLRPVVVESTEVSEMEVIRGRITQGDQADLLVVDREPMILSGLGKDTLIEFIVESNSTLFAPHEITFRLVGRQQHIEDAMFVVEMYDWSTASYDPVDKVTRSVPQQRFGLIDYRCTGDLLRYQRPQDRRLRARVRVVGTKLAFPWYMELDQLVWIVR